MRVSEGLPLSNCQTRVLLIKDNHEKIVISLDETKFSDYEGVKHLRPWELGQSG